jgi:hypothetical protein
MKTCQPVLHFCFPRLLLLPGMLALFLLTGCSSERRDRLWQTLDPAGYKHSHSESFNGSRAVRSPQSSRTPASDEMALGLDP